MVEWCDCQPSCITWDELEWELGDYWKRAVVAGFHGSKIIFNVSISPDASMGQFIVAPPGTICMNIYIDGFMSGAEGIDPLTARVWLDAFQRGELPEEVT